MEVTLVGLNHKTASVDIRERLAFDQEATLAALKRIRTEFPQAEFILLSTCNRMELYSASVADQKPDTQDLIAFLADSRDVPAEEFRSFLYVRHDEDAVRHLLTVASSLDSMVVGESQIIAQVKHSYSLACQAESVGKILSHLFHTAFNTSKRIYTDTTISNRRVSVAGVAVDLAAQLFEDITKAKVVVIGAGDMGQLLIEHFLHIDCKDITVVNRSVQRGRSVAKRYNIAFSPWDDLNEELKGANIVVAAATAADGYLFNKSEFVKTMAARRRKTLLAIDIAVPRNFDPLINKIENVYLYSVDDLAQVVHENIKLRQEDVDEAVEIICEKVSEYTEWLRSIDIGPLIGQIKESFERIRHNELEKFFVGPRQDASCRDVMAATVSRVVNKLLHCVIKNINTVAKEQSPAHAAKLAGSIVEQAEEIISHVPGKEKE